MLTLYDTDRKGVVELKEAENESMFLRRGCSTTLHFYRKKPATCGRNSARSKIRKKCFFHEEKLIRQSHCWFSWLQQHEPKPAKAKKRKESPMEGSDEEAADRKHHKTDSDSAKAKCFAFLDEESSCSGDNPSQSEKDPYVRTKQMVATCLNEPHCESYVCPLQVQMGQCQRYPENATIALKYLSASVSSVASAGVFKVAIHLTNGSRTRLKPDNVKKSLFLKHNFKAIGGYDSIILSDIRLTR